MIDRNNSEFDDIRPFSEKEGLAAIQQLFSDHNFIKALQFVNDEIDINQLCQSVLACKSLHEFQIAFSKTMFHYFVKKSITHITFEGTEKDGNRPASLYIGNHRDIILDSMILQASKLGKGIPATRSAIGNNLVDNPLLIMLARLNKMFLVYRDDKAKEDVLKHYRQLGDYINFSILEEKESVWIAQRNGRAKDGIDKTQPGLLKMFILPSKLPAIEALKMLNITTATVSYQYEPCDHLKARELALSENGSYVKKPGEDFTSITQGVLGFKGEVHFCIGETIKEGFDAIDTKLPLNDQLAQARDIVDSQIHQDYHLFNTNYIAYDLAEQTTKFEQYYTQEEKADFERYLDKQASCDDVPKEKMLHYLLKIYSNPVRMKKL